MQVIYARRKYKVSPPETTGHPEFERTFRAHALCAKVCVLIWSTSAGVFLSIHDNSPSGIVRQPNYKLVAVWRRCRAFTIRIIKFNITIGSKWANCSEYFPIFISLLWVAGIFFHQGVTAVCGLLYLYTRLRYFQGYAGAARGRLGPLYASAWLLWALLGLALAGLLAHFLRPSSSTWMAALVWPLQLHGAW
ncbi:leukotriene C4 synthase isoform X1 [Zonotrichia albicollis]|uniref:leukotriene C4 synthase isoform X1 n=1 Tax=Zonotrichia albicollis TaxID=44394 RepID=UPI003D80B0ED